MPKTKTAEAALREQVGKRVRRLRVAKELTQAALGGRCGCDQATISKVEQGDYRALTIALIIDLAYGLEVPPGEILEWPFGIMHVAAHDPGRPSIEAVSA